MPGTATEKGIGELSVVLGIERKVLDNGYLSKLDLTETAVAVTGIVDQLIREGNWRQAVQLRHGDGPARLVYIGNSADFSAALLAAIPSSDFPEDSREFSQYSSGKKLADDLKLLAKREEFDVLQSLIEREDMPLTSATYINDFLGKSQGTETSNSNLSMLGKRIQDTDPHEAYALFSSAHDTEAITQLYEKLDADFHVNNFCFLVGIVDPEAFIRNDDEVEARTLKLQGLVRKALDSSDLEEANQDTRREVFRLAYVTRMDLKSEEQERLNLLVVKDMDKRELSEGIERSFGHITHRESLDIFKGLTLLWAQTQWERVPEEAYGIFIAESYQGEEVLACAEKLFYAVLNSSRRAHKVVTLAFKHLSAIMDKTPLDNHEARLKLAHELGDKTEFIRLGNIKAIEHNFEEAYRLIVDYGDMDPNDPLVADLGKIIVQEKLDEALSEGRGAPYFRFHENDKSSYDEFYKVLIADHDGETWTGKAFELATRHGDIDRVQETRALIFERNPPQIALKFFQKASDTPGYQTAITALAQEYNVSEDQVVSLVGGIAEAKDDRFPLLPTVK